jgi:uncharacterized protein
MSTRIVGVRLCMVVVCCIPMVARADGPPFACGQVQTEVERLVCGDAGLASLDRQLDQVYRSALAKAHAPLARRLREDQRGWVKGRNDCWKANGHKTWITASWTVDTVRDCVQAQYRLRISELQAVWRLLPPRTRSFACQGQPANEVVLNFFDTDPPTLRLERGDRTRTLWRVDGAGAGRYEGQNVSLLHEADSVTLTWMNIDTGKDEQWKCQSR